jgi:hypothetical protein
MATPTATSKCCSQPALPSLVHHDDAEREYAYDEKAERALAVVARDGWTIVSMRDDWATVFAQQPAVATAVAVG